MSKFNKFCKIFFAIFAVIMLIAWIVIWVFVSDYEKNVAINIVKEIGDLYKQGKSIEGIQNSL